MSKNLVIVESPTKARTLARFLGDGYTIKASLGHVRDLPPHEMGVDVTDGFSPKYVVLPDKRSVLKELKKLAQEAGQIYLATDPDREGEAISWHLVQAVGLKSGSVRRVVFHEITEEAVKEAFRHPREIDMRLVNAQQARRILDRLVGYRLSPLLWSKLRWPRYSLSAGRVQSAALRLIVEREREIQAFVPREYWLIEATLARIDHGKRAPFRARLHSQEGHAKKIELPDKDAAQAITSDLEGADYQVAHISKKEAHSRPSPPFITSTLQQEAWRKLGFSAKKTMLLAQQLYEGVPLGDEGPVGLITYMRTDSTHISHQALREVRTYILEKFKENYLPKNPRLFKEKVKGAQEAHEAIRPTSTHREPPVVKASLTPDQLKLYELIWRRFVASQMSDALLENTTADIRASHTRSGSRYIFRAAGSVVKFNGFRAIYTEGRDEPEEEDESTLPTLTPGEALDLQELQAEHRFTQPPPRYTEATLIRALEEKGIGRPSTYAAIVSTIQERRYVKRDGGKLHPQPLGIVVTELLENHFPKVVDLGFTAQMENDLDEVAQGRREWVPVLKEFYVPFDQALSHAHEEIPSVAVPSGETCEKCGKPMVIRGGRFGQFIACSGYPDCRNTRPYLVRTGATCPQCKGDLVERRGKKRGRTFYGCSNYPNCNFSLQRKPLPQPCPQCSNLLVASRQGAQCTSCDFKGPIPTEEAVEA